MRPAIPHSGKPSHLEYRGNTLILPMNMQKGGIPTRLHILPTLQDHSVASQTARSRTSTRWSLPLTATKLALSCNCRCKLVWYSSSLRFNSICFCTKLAFMKTGLRGFMMPGCAMAENTSRELSLFFATVQQILRSAEVPTCLPPPSVLFSNG